MYIYMVVNSKTIGDIGILVLANSICQVRKKYNDCIVHKWCHTSKKTIDQKLFADDLTGSTSKKYMYNVNYK